MSQHDVQIFKVSLFHRYFNDNFPAFVAFFVSIFNMDVISAILLEFLLGEPI
mgnify:FL=1